ncbi:hypothetical protein [Streptomyces kanamyceticus]|uniref:Ornithine cyclodeaminase n=1 Tax=Streptomyces kanamyceticus TaxID=1967 RepID=A0A5J6G9L9_STRKN|nr:hypothetical protein [Streptomyces kanamyceticus]QEU91312.1 hypothetical protein CP970_10825 [Streptomyces kanamyceticus]
MSPFPRLRLTTGEAESAVRGLDAVDVVREALTMPSDATGDESVMSFDAAADELLLYDRVTRQEWRLPASTAVRLWRACLCAAAARAFVAPGVITAGVIGADAMDNASLVLLSRALPGLSHVALYDDEAPGPDGGTRPPRDVPGVRDVRTVRGGDDVVALALMRSAREALLGADLVVLASNATCVAGEWLARGTVLVNATAQDVTDDLHKEVAHLVVDDPRLLSLAPGRRAARMAEPPTRLGQLLGVGAVLRRHRDDTVLVDLYGAGLHQQWFVTRLCRSAHVRGLGRRCGR